MEQKIFNEIWDELFEMGYNNKMDFEKLWEQIKPHIHNDTKSHELLFCQCDDEYLIELWDDVGVYELIWFDFDFDNIRLSNDIINYNGCSDFTDECIDCFYYKYEHTRIINGYLYGGK